MENEEKGSSRMLKGASFWEKLFPHTEPRLPQPMALIRETFRPYLFGLGVYLGIYFITLLVIVAILWLGVSSGKGLLSGGLVSLGSVTLFIALFLIMLFISYWSKASVLTAVIKRDQQIGIFSSFKESLPKVVPFFWIVLLGGFITVGGFIFFIIPGIMLAVWFCFATIVYISEGTEGVSALLKSKGYVRGYWWPVLGRLIFVTLVLLVVYLIVGIILSLIFHGASVHRQVATTWRVIYAFFAVPFVLSYLYVMYKKLVDIKGHLVVAAPRRTKGWLTFFGVLGVLIVILWCAALGTFVRSGGLKAIEMQSKQNEMFPGNETPNTPPPVPSVPGGTNSTETSAPDTTTI